MVNPTLIPAVNCLICLVSYGSYGFSIWKEPKRQSTSTLGVETDMLLDPTSTINRLCAAQAQASQDVCCPGGDARSETSGHCEVEKLHSKTDRGLEVSVIKAKTFYITLHHFTSSFNLLYLIQYRSSTPKQRANGILGDHSDHPT